MNNSNDNYTSENEMLLLKAKELLAPAPDAPHICGLISGGKCPLMMCALNAIKDSGRR